MAMSTGGGPGSAMADINVTPLVDVMLVLLIIFMVTAPMMQESAGVTVELPRSEAPPLDPTEEQLVLSIDGDHKIWIGDNAFTAEEVPEKLAAIAQVNPELDVFLRADGSVPYRQIAALLGVAKKAGMVRVGLVFEPGVGDLSGLREE